MHLKAISPALGEKLFGRRGRRADSAGHYPSMRGSGGGRERDRHERERRRDRSPYRERRRSRDRRRY
ncbi:hypothetical protein ANCDUO_10911 [Ancylostoma duodenale]|uniref:Uncharacterized protein n=1 Tax=Ancylostoma duodenale TaxID=51022 RepID=A0A0C2GJ59_9BILA|nr:hypothetical protein ANCDUO_10911 [Ancylostoma duodenale]